jgi:hypothetical protein
MVEETLFVLGQGPLLLSQVGIGNQASLNGCLRGPRLEEDFTVEIRETLRKESRYIVREMELEMGTDRPDDAHPLLLTKHVLIDG